MLFSKPFDYRYSRNSTFSALLIREALLVEKKTYAIEIEAGGIKDTTRVGNKGCLVIRGVYDFCDDNKMDDFHYYAATIAVIYMAFQSIQPPSVSGAAKAGLLGFCLACFGISPQYR